MEDNNKQIQSENLSEWLLALRSGDYDQVKGFYKQPREDKDPAYDPVGVAQSLFKCDAGELIVSYLTGVDLAIITEAVSMNDADKDFESIADFIEAHA